MSDYKNTLNLPHTDFPMKANLSQRELEILKHWEDIRLYEELRKRGEGRKKFILHDGPPYANGHIHIGHALNKILKDIIMKSKTLSGFDTPFVPGWDCHGLPIELNVEKKYGKPGVKISETEFRQKCREYAAEQINIQRAEFKRLGILADWENPYRTMDFKYEANTIRALGKIIKKGFLKRDYKPVHWCTDCGSALAEAEVEYQDKESLALDVRFKLTDIHQLSSRGLTAGSSVASVSIPIWTTTPWTLPANQAVAVNPSHDYSLVKVNDNEGLIIATELLASTLARYQIENYEVLGECKGKALEYLELQHPFQDRTVPVILGDHVTLDAGTGAVHTAPAHGQDDYAAARHYDLSSENMPSRLVDEKGCFITHAFTGPLAGQHISKVNPLILELLGNTVLHQEKLKHSYPHCWRHKTPLIFLATPQWFIKMDGLENPAQAAIRATQWIPGWGENRILGMVTDRPDWCISRQRAWGVPIPLYVNESDALHPDTENLIEDIAKHVEKEGVDYWFDKAPQVIDKYTKRSNTLDVWFDAGVSHFCVLNSEQADLYLEGSDQHRGWFQSSLLTSVIMNERAPYKTVLTHGYTVDPQGRKMSKSLGNVIPPEKVINSLGADILRLWVASTDYRGEVTVSDEIFKRTSDTYRRIRNTARFLLANLHGFDPVNATVPTVAIDCWIVERARLLQEEIKAAYDSYQFHLIYQKIHNFCSIELGSFYLDIIKDRQYTTPTQSLARLSAQTAMYHIAEALVRWLAPILSFTAEELWSYLPGKREASVFLSTWYDQFPMQDKLTPSLSEWDLIIEVRNIVNKELERQRSEGQIGSALEAEVCLYCVPDSKIISVLKNLGDELRFVLITSQASICESMLEVETLYATSLLSNNESIGIQVQASSDPKCARCWHRRPINISPKYPDICERCVTNITTELGEKRYYA